MARNAASPGAPRSDFRSTASDFITKRDAATLRERRGGAFVKTQPRAIVAIAIAERPLIYIAKT
jgi:hypothetical protein